MSSKRKSKIDLTCGLSFRSGQRAGRAAELLARLFEMIFIEMRIAKDMHEIADIEARDMRDHRGEKCVACDVERHPQKHVRRTLVELA